MKKKIKIFIGISIGALILSSIGFGIIVPLTNPKTSVIFYPVDFKSYPDHTAWLLADVNCEVPVDFYIETNIEVPVTWKTWCTSNTSYLVEIFLIPSTEHIDKEIIVNLIASTESRQFRVGSYEIDVIDWNSSNENEILEIRDHFVQYIINNTTFSNLNSSTTWSFCGSPAQILIVEHYLFQSDFWEMEISLHVMIPPHDWVQIYIRPRNQTTPIWSAKIDSWNLDNSSIYEIAPPDEVFR